MPRDSLRVLLVDDSPLVLAILRRMIETAPDLQIVATAANGEEALQKLDTLEVDVICTDLNMPRVDGLELTRRIMRSKPKPILVISVAVQKEDEHNVFELLRAGAVDVFPKPKGGLKSEEAEWTKALVNKIRVVAGVVVFHKHGERDAPPPRQTSVVAPAPQIELVSMAASTGGPQAYAAVLSALPANFSAPILCVQHISLGFLDGLVRWLNDRCTIQVRVAKDGDTVRPGIVYFPEEDTHLEIEHGGRVRSVRSEAFHGFRPSATVLFESVAKSYGKRAAGVLMTGMGDDGARGLKALRDAGGLTIAQDEATSVVYGMPREAARLGAAQHVLALDEIAPAMLRIFRT